MGHRPVWLFRSGLSPGRDKRKSGVEVQPNTGNETNGHGTQVIGGSFTPATSSGTQIVSGIGFVPKVVFVFGVFNGAGVTSSDLFGAADAKCRQWAMTTRNNDAVTPSAADRAWDYAVHR